MEKDELEMHEEFKTEVIDDDERDTGDVERGAEDDCVQPKASFDVIECDLDEENNPSKSQSGYVNPIAIYRYPCRHCELRFTSGHRRSKHEAQEHGVTDSKSQQKQPSQFDHHLALPLSINIS
ncbi:unnamed protein product [Darwinula stevensoni]|uniref:C2H2-type domain-containing protein n=1 Tax=Darwinula stevensoni TaxID=69355 RepID=A0A7R8X462_9CRUS|nr:unnamed protein product [Darwinula stevensoni]CAG0879169.1 unnamed protein product [Darwinula stevensoni]